MQKLSRAAFFAIAAMLITGTIVAQAPGCDTGGNVAFTVNGSGPDGMGQVTINPGSIASFDFADGDQGQGVIVIVTALGLNCGFLPTPWGGSVDLAGPALLFDGVGNTVSPFDFLAETDFSFSFSFGCGLAGLSGIALQGVHEEATLPPFFFDNTVAIELDVPTVINRTVPGTLLPDDSAFFHSLSCVDITFYGQTYESFFVGSNGQITFEQGDADFSPSLPELYAGFTSATLPNPGVAVLWADLNRGGFEGDYIIDEDTMSGSVKVTFANQSWWDSQTPAGTASVEFGVLSPGSVIFDHTGFIAGTGGVDQDPVIGVSDGDGTVGTDSDPGGILLGYSSPLAGDSIGHQYPSAGGDLLDPLPLGITTWLDIGGGNWTIF